MRRVAEVPKERAEKKLNEMSCARGCTGGLSGLDEDQGIGVELEDRKCPVEELEC